MEQIKQIQLIKTLFEYQEPIWYVRTENLFFHVIRTQRIAAQRNLFPIHFWRFLPEKSEYNEVYQESYVGKRSYAKNISVFFYIEHGQQQKPLTKAGVDTQIEQQINIDLAEIIRLGEEYKETQMDIPFYSYIPKAGDVYQWNKSLFQIKEVKPEIFYVPMQKYITWKGEAALFRTESVDPTIPLVALNNAPEIQHPIWLK